MIDNNIIENILEVVKLELYKFETFMASVQKYFLVKPELMGPPSLIHSMKSRIKNIEHLRNKIIRKSTEQDPITPENIFCKITDIAGIRVLHLYQQQFAVIHKCIQNQFDNNEWVLYEEPKAYSWDPESKTYFESLNLKVEIKESFYTSIHYIIKPREDSNITCEIQIRTLFEEIWGEIDHIINYPQGTKSLACREQLRVLARLVSAGSRLADSIFLIYNDESSNKNKM